MEGNELGWQARSFHGEWVWALKQRLASILRTLRRRAHEIRARRSPQRECVVLGRVRSIIA